MKEIKALEGIVNGIPILFYRDSVYSWKINIPKVPNGMYLVELYAEDYAGNKSFFASAILKVDITGITFEVLSENFTFKPLEPVLEAHELQENFFYEELIL